MSQFGKVFQIENKEVWFSGRCLERDTKILYLNNERNSREFFAVFLVLTGHNTGKMVYRRFVSVSEENEEFEVNRFFKHERIFPCETSW